MHSTYLAGLVLLAFTLAFAGLGMVLVRHHRLRRRSAGSYSRLCAVLALAGAWALAGYLWPDLHFRPVDFWSMMAILGIAAYALIWATIAHQFNRQGPDEFGDGFMLSMLYSDVDHVPPREAERKRSAGRNQR